MPIPALTPEQENDKRYQANLILPIRQSSNVQITLGKCYGFSMEWALWKLKPGIKTVFKIREELPLMPIAKANIYNNSINDFIPSSRRVDAFMFSQAFPFDYALHTDFQLKFYLLEKGFKKMLRTMAATYQDNLCQHACNIILIGAIFGHSICFKKYPNGIIAFFDANKGEYQISSMDNFIEWLPNYLRINYGNEFYASTFETLKLSEPSTHISKLISSANNLLIHVGLYFPLILTKPIGIIRNTSGFISSALSLAKNFLPSFSSPKKEVTLLKHNKDIFAHDDNLAISRILTQRNTYMIQTKPNTEYHCDNGLYLFEKHRKNAERPERKHYAADDCSLTPNLAAKLNKGALPMTKKISYMGLYSNKPKSAHIAKPTMPKLRKPSF